MITAREQHWPNQAPNTITNQKSANQFTDSQTKSSVLFNYIHKSLTKASKEQLNTDLDLFNVTDLAENKYINGPS